MRPKDLYVSVVRWVSRWLTRAGLIADHPPVRQNRIRHWLYSLPRIHNSVEIAELDVPWWTYGAIEYVDRWLAARPGPVQVFEFGAGASTLFLARRADHVYSVEHHRGFAESIRPLIEETGKAELIVREPTRSATPEVGSHKPGYKDADFADYVAAIDDVGGLFDLIVIDGRAREACLAAAIPHLKDGGVIVYDNTHRARYRRAIARSGLHETSLPGLTPTLPYPDRTSILERC